jgi:hypothetical protein
LPSHDVLDLLKDANDTIIRAAGADTLVAQTTEHWLNEVAKLIEEERREWEATLTLVMDEDRDHEDYVI